MGFHVSLGECNPQHPKVLARGHFAGSRIAECGRVGRAAALLVLEGGVGSVMQDLGSGGWGFRVEGVKILGFGFKVWGL